MGVYSSQAESCNIHLDSAIAKLESVKANQYGTLSKLGDNQDVLAEGITKSCTPISGKIDTAIATINSLKSSISAKAAELDAALEEERRRREAANNN